MIGSAIPNDDWLLEFGIDAIYQSPTGETTTIRVYFDEHYAESDVENLTVVNRTAQAACKTSDVAGANEHSRLTIDGRTFNVIKEQPDGTGMSVLTLSLD